MRAAVENHHTRSASERWFRTLLFNTLPYPGRLRVLGVPLLLLGPLRRSAAFLRLVPRRLRPMLTLAPDVSTSSLMQNTPELTPPSGERRMRVGLVTGCVQRAFFGGVNQATARVLAAEGCEVAAPREQGCCGALALHAGEPDRARVFARDLIAAFERAKVDFIAVNAAGCGSAMKDYGHLLRDDAAWATRAEAFSRKVRDVTELLAQLGPPRATRHPVQARVAYHDACHLAHAQGIRAQPRELLRAIPGVTLTMVAESEVCCGSAGIFNLTQPDMAAELGRRKATHLSDEKPDVVVTSNPGCMLQIRSAAAEQGNTFQVLHIVELLDASISGRTIA